MDVGGEHGGRGTFEVRDRGRLEIRRGEAITLVLGSGEYVRQVLPRMVTEDAPARVPPMETAPSVPGGTERKSGRRTVGVRSACPTSVPTVSMKAVAKAGGTLVITADHGNAEVLVERDADG